jgi:competence ComEA-like helix-hairpin-helix protein
MKNQSADPASPGSPSSLPLSPQSSVLSPPNVFWTFAQRRALIALIGIAWLALLARAFFSPVYISDSPPDSSVALAMIDPNTATAAELSSIPGIGPARAAALIHYRDDFATSHPGQPAFRRPDDLMMVKGIGPGTMEKMEPYLEFGPRSK